MTLGEILKDFYRLSRLTAKHRWIVLLIKSQLLGYLNRVQRRQPLQWVTVVGQTFSCTGETVTGLPKTARTAIGPWPVDHAVAAECCFARSLPDKSLLVTYRVVEVSGPDDMRLSAGAPPQSSATTN